MNDWYLSKRSVWQSKLVGSLLDSSHTIFHGTRNTLIRGLRQPSSPHSTHPVLSTRSSHFSHTHATTLPASVSSRTHVGSPSRDSLRWLLSRHYAPTQHRSTRILESSQHAQTRLRRTHTLDSGTHSPRACFIRATHLLCSQHC